MNHFERGESRQDTDQSYEGSIEYSGGDLIYRPKNESDPANIISAAKKAALQHGAQNALKRKNVFVIIPGRGEYRVGNLTTLEDLDEQDRRREAETLLQTTLNGLDADQLEDVRHFARTLSKKA